MNLCNFSNFNSVSSMMHKSNGKTATVGEKYLSIKHSKDRKLYAGKSPFSYCQHMRQLLHFYYDWYFRVLPYSPSGNHSRWIRIFDLEQTSC